MFTFTDKERIQLQLMIVHQNTARETEKKLADIRASLHNSWDSTLAMIDAMKEAREIKYHDRVA